MPPPSPLSHLLRQIHDEKQLSFPHFFHVYIGEQLAKMWASSPIALVDQVTAPVLLALGKKDRRVPFSQGLEYYHALRARG